jgi:hypothetical protein
MGSGLYNGPGSGIAGAGGGAPGPSSVLTEALERIRTLETRHTGTPVKIGTTTFANFADVKAFVALHIPKPNFGVLSDMVIILQKLKTETETATTLIAAHAGARKLNLDVMEANIVISFSMLLPSILDRSREIVSSSNVHAIPAVKKYSEWTNSLVGLKAKMASEITNESLTITNRIMVCDMSETARGIFTTMLATTQKHWQSTEQFVDNQMLKLTGDYGLDETEAWTLTTKGLREVFVQLRGLRSVAQDMLNSCTGKPEQFALAMWACLQAHQLMNEYIACGFIGHHTLASIRAEHILTHRVSPGDLKVLADRIVTLQGSFVGLTGDVDALLAHTKVASKRKRKS